MKLNKEIFNSLLKDIILEVMEEDDIEEATVTGDVSGYNTPYAFNSKSKKSKKKKKKNAENSTGYKMVKEELTNRDFIQIKGIIRNEVAAILRDIWLRRSVWANRK